MPRHNRAVDPSPEDIKERALKIKKDNLLKMAESDPKTKEKYIPTVYYLSIDPSNNYYLQSKPK